METQQKCIDEPQGRFNQTGHVKGKKTSIHFLALIYENGTLNFVFCSC